MSKTASVADKEEVRMVITRNHHKRRAEQQQEEDDSSVASTRQTRGKWGLEEDDDDDGMEDVAWNGCVCGKIHARPIPVYWIQCEGVCQAWYNVTPKCVNYMTQKQAAQQIWNCHACTKLQQHNTSPLLTTELPGEVWYLILEYCAAPTYRAAVVCQQLAPLCRSARHLFVQHGSRHLWNTILQREYTAITDGSIKTKEDSSSPTTTATTTASARRSSKRRRKRTNFLAPSSTTSSSSHPRHIAMQEHRAMLTRTDDVYYVVEELADPSNAGSRQQPAIFRDAVRVMQNHTASSHNKKQQLQQTLTLSKLRRLLKQNAPLNVNRVSNTTGRTLLQVVCCAETTENVVAACAAHLLHYYEADPNIMSTHEQPYANRTALFFAIARTMPKLVQTLLDAGSHYLDQTATGRFKMTFDTSLETEGTFTPYQYALEMKRVEVLEPMAVAAGQTRRHHHQVPPYWVSRLNKIIRILAALEEEEVDYDGEE